MSRPISDERAAFEKYWTDNYTGPLTVDDYPATDAQLCWLGWQAALTHKSDGAVPASDLRPGIPCSEYRAGFRQGYSEGSVEGAFDRAIESAAPVAVPVDANQTQHDDDDAVDLFAGAMKAKLAVARANGRSGWEQCSGADLSTMLREHVEKGDPRDVANFCMFLWNLEQRIAAIPVLPVDAGVRARAVRIIEQLEVATTPDILLKHTQIAGLAFSLLREIVATPAPHSGEAAPAQGEPTDETLEQLASSCGLYGARKAAVAYAHEVLKLAAPLPRASDAPIGEAGGVVAEPAFWADDEQMAEWYAGKRGAIDIRVVSIRLGSCNTPLFAAQPQAAPSGLSDAQVRYTKESLGKAYRLGQVYWQQADSDSWRQQDKSSETQDKFETLVSETIDYLRLVQGS